VSRIVAIANQKGGVGKTTTSVNIAASMHATRRKTLLVDLDPQGNATVGSGVDKNALTISVFDVLMDESLNIRDAILCDVAGGYDLIGGNSDLTGAEIGLLEQTERETRLKRAFRPIFEDYEYIFIDCPPSLNMLTVNALVVAHGLMIPTQCEYYALEGLSALLETVKKIKRVLNPELEIDGVLRTMFDSRNNLAREVSGQLMAHFGEKVYRTIIPRNVRLAEAPSHGMPALVYDSASAGSLAYLSLAGEMLRGK
jgi:chromosome partitioning protein